MQESLFLKNLSGSEFDLLCSHAVERHYDENDVIFEEGDSASELFFVKSGRVSIYIHKYHRTEDISSIDSGDCFGEMAVLSNTHRTASAKAQQATTLMCLDKKTFRSVIKAHDEIGAKIQALVARRNEELALKESIQDSIGFHEGDLHLGIKGDPSLRETVFNRERYESLVDMILPELTPNLESMLVERNAFRIYLNFNSGEIEVYTVFNPFIPETHAANRLISSSYLDRHFPLISYDEKSQIILKIYTSLADEPYLKNLSSHWQHLFIEPLTNWKPVSIDKIKHAISQLAKLRSMEYYYLRNFSISTIQDVIRMQFNCDGTHIVNNEDYLRFLDENL